MSLIRPGTGWLLGNGSSDRMLGYPPGTTRLDNRPSFVHPDDLASAIAAFQEVVAGTRGPNEPWLVRVAAADGSWHWFESAAVDLRDNPDVDAILVSTRDATERVVRAQQHQLIVEQSPLGIWTLDDQGRISFVNERFASMLGHRVDELLGTRAEDHYPERARAGFRERWDASAPGKRFHTREMPYLHRDGHEVVVEVTSTALFDPNGRFIGGMGLFRDRTHELELEARAATSELRFGVLVEHSSDVISVLGSDRQWRYASPAATRLLGYPDDSSLERALGSVHPDDVEVIADALDEIFAGTRGPDEPVTVRMITADGATRHFETTGVNLLDEPLIDGIMLVSRDVTDRVLLSAALAHAAGHDALTDLVSRGAFRDRLDEALARADREDRSVWLAYVDLDHFKPVNDTHGHQVGDEVLVAVADVLRTCTRAGDVPARLGGDEFVVLYEGVTGSPAPGPAIDRLAAALAEPHPTSAGPLQVGASIGVARSHTGDDGRALLARADGALYRAKRDGRGFVVVADDPT